MAVEACSVRSASTWTGRSGSGRPEGIKRVRRLVSRLEDPGAT
jgi:hypothetical protein